MDNTDPYLRKGFLVHHQLGVVRCEEDLLLREFNPEYIPITKLKRIVTSRHQNIE
jgi:hypothetical protein